MFARGLFVPCLMLCLMLCLLVLPAPVRGADHSPVLSRTRLTTITGRSSQLKVKNYSKKVTWTSSNPYVATVSRSGVVKAAHMGYTVILAKAGDSELKCYVTVNGRKAEKPFIFCYEADHDGVQIETGQFYNLVVMNGQTKTWTWSVSDPEKALLYKDGNSITSTTTSGRIGQLVVTFMGKPGTVTVTAKSGSIKLTYQLVIRKSAEDDAYLKMRSEVLSQLITPDMRPEEQCLAVAKWLSDYASYVVTNGADYSMLSNHVGQCYHYAKTFDFMMAGTSVPCRYVCTKSHAWNQVQIDGNWYNVDVTAFDTDVPGNPYDYTFFLVSDEAFWRKDARMEPYHVCASTKYDFGKHYSDSPWADGTWMN